MKLVPSLLVPALLALTLGACAATSGSSAVPASAPAGEPAMPVPTKEHEALMKAVGAWEGTVTMFGPDMPAEPTPARETVQAIGGFWTQSRFECEFMGVPYLGSGVFGYDPESGKYVGTWIDSFSSFMARMEGEKDSSGKIVMRWMAPDMTGEIVPHRSEETRDADSYSMTFYIGKGKGEKSMTIEMRRKSGTSYTIEYPGDGIALGRVERIVYGK